MDKQQASVAIAALFSATSLILMGYAQWALIPIVAAGLVTLFLKGPGGWRAIALRAGGSWIAAVGIMGAGASLATLYRG